MSQDLYKFHKYSDLHRGDGLWMLHVYKDNLKLTPDLMSSIVIWVWGQWANRMQLLAWCCRCYLLAFIFFYLLSAYLRTNSDVESESDLPVTSARGAAARKVADDDLDDDFDFYG